MHMAGAGMHRGGRGDARASCASPLGTPLVTSCMNISKECCGLTQRKINREKNNNKKTNQSIRQTVTSVQGPHGPVAPISQKLSSMLNGSRWEAGTPRLSQTSRTFSRGVNGYRLLSGNAKLDRKSP
jgi:hypothetical protein